jgi:hypothetical protein
MTLAQQIKNMKKLLIMLLAILTIRCFGQDTTSVYSRIRQFKKNDYVEATNLDDFAGVWISKNQAQNLKLILIKKPKIKAGNTDHPFYIDLLVGGGVFKRYGQEIFNNLKDIEIRPQLGGLVLNDHEAMLSFRVEWEEMATKASFILQKNKKIAIWKLKKKISKEEMLTYPNSMYQIPEEIILYKQE